MRTLIFSFLVISLSFSSLSAQSLKTKDHQAIMQVFAEQEHAWNTGDIPAFMEGYWKSDSLTFVSTRGMTFGWQNTLDNYIKGYPDRTAMGKLSFDILRMKAMGKKAAHVIGKWYLKREIGDIGGHFTLIWRKIGGKWVIVADHTS